MHSKNIGHPFRENDYVIYPCPRCGKLSLKHDAKTLVTKETSISQKSRNDYGWEPEWIEMIFSSWFVCEDKACEETVVCSGKAFVDYEIEEDEEGYPSQQFYNYYAPITFVPNLKYLDIPRLCPDTVTLNLNEAFQITLLSPSSAANKVRAAVENLLTELNVKKYNIQKRKRVFINLHSRIELAASQKKISNELKDILLAIKWLGNDGSHAISNISKNDILDAYEMIEYVLKKIYLPDNSIQNKVQTILKYKGVKKRK